MVMGTSPASSEIQKRIRQIIGKCRNAIHIKDDILIHGKGKEYDKYLAEVLKVLQDNGITCRPDKCHLGQTEVTWFGNVYSKNGMSPDPEKCTVIRNWPAPKSCSEVKSFLQTVQFNEKISWRGTRRTLLSRDYRAPACTNEEKCPFSVGTQGKESI